MSLKAAAQHLAAHGRNGDTTLVHMTKDEVQTMRDVGHKIGLPITTNPHTGLPEASAWTSFRDAAIPIAAGAMLGPAGFGIADSALAAGLMVGGGTALLTGDLNRGLMAGLGAYGGAGASNAVNAAGSAEIGKKASEEALKEGLSGEVANQKMQEAMTNASGLQKIMAAAGSPGTTAAAAGGAGQLAMYGGAALSGSGLMSGKAPGASAPPTAAGYIRPKYAYRDNQGNVQYVDLPAIKAADWGSQNINDYVASQVAPQPKYMADGGVADSNATTDYTPYDDQSLEYQNNPVIRMADGGDTTTPYNPVSASQINDYIAQNNLDSAGIAAAAKQFNVDPNAVTAAQNAQNTVQNVYENVLGRNADPSGLAYWTNQIASGTSTPDQMYANFLTAAKQNQEIMTHPDYTLSQATSPYAGYASSDKRDIVDEWTQNVLGRGVTEAEKQQQWYKDATNAGTMNTYGAAQNIYGNFDAYAKSIADMETQNKLNQARQKIAGMGLTEADVQAQTGKTLAQLVGMPNTGLDIFHASQLIAPIKAFDFASLTPKQKAALAAGSTSDTYTGQPTTTPQTYAPAGTQNPYGNAINPGDITINPDGSRTITPNIPGRPYGGFTGMGQVRDAYTAGGGHLGQVLKPTQDYTTSGGTKAAYDYLMGKGTWASTKPTIPQIQDTYSDFNNPTAAEKKLNAGFHKVWRNGVQVDNPYYVDPAIAQAKAAADAAKPWATTTAADSTNSGAKAGGLMAAYAGGGETHYNLGGYSDGGRLLKGPGDGVSDSIPATIGGKQPARLADGEFVVPARIVSEIGNGSTEAGARKLYAMMDRVQAARRQTVGKGKVAKNTRADKYLPK